MSIELLPAPVMALRPAKTAPVFSRPLVPFTNKDSEPPPFFSPPQAVLGLGNSPPFYRLFRLRAHPAFRFSRLRRDQIGKCFLLLFSLLEAPKIRSLSAFAFLVRSRIIQRGLPFASASVPTKHVHVLFLLSSWQTATAVFFFLPTEPN